MAAVYGIAPLAYADTASADLSLVATVAPQLTVEAPTVPTAPTNPTSPTASTSPTDGTGSTGTTTGNTPTVPTTPTPPVPPVCPTGPTAPTAPSTPGGTTGPTGSTGTTGSECLPTDGNPGGNPGGGTGTTTPGTGTTTPPTDGGGSGGGSGDSDDDSSGGGSSGGGRSRSGGGRSSSNDDGEVLGASTGSCTLLLNTYMRQGQSNDTYEVAKLQSFLNDHLGTNIPLTGYFGAITERAVNQFQLQYHDDVLEPWVPYGLPNDMTPTGYVYKTTQYKINKIFCPSVDINMPTLP